MVIVSVSTDSTETVSISRLYNSLNNVANFFVIAKFATG